MIKDITLGQYYPAESILHKLDPRVKLLSVLLYMIGVFLNNSIMGYSINIILLLILISLSNIPLRQILRGVRSIFILLLFSVVFTILFTPGEQMLFSWGIVKISVHGIMLAVQIMIRIYLLILMSTLLTLTTMPTDIADGLEKACGGFQKIGIPVHEIVMMITIALRFIPILMEETNKIIMAQKARGADFESGGFIHKAKGMLPLFVPLIVASMKRAMDLAMAMEARCYRGGENRTKMKPLQYHKADKMSYLLLGVYVILMVAIKLIFCKNNGCI